MPGTPSAIPAPADGRPVPVRPDARAGPRRRRRSTAAIEVALEIVEPVTEIVLNANELKLDDATLTAADGTPVEVVEGPHRRRRRARDRRRSPRRPSRGTGRSGSRSAGELNPRLTGFYRSTYKDEDGRTQVIGTTHFEATDARRAFPCWDEPDLKAVFATTLVVKEGLTAVSNGPEVERETLGDGRVRIRFADTMKMSTYLAAWVVGPLELTEPADARGVPIADRPRARQGTPDVVRVGLVRPLAELVRATTTASRTPRPSSTTSRSRTSRRARWRTSAA